MARLDQAHPDNVEGDWFVDTRCIACDVARHYAPGLIERDEQGRSVLARQPGTAAEEAALWRAALACPTRSIGTRERRRTPAGVFPWELVDGIHLCGHNDVSSFGAHSYLVVRPDGNLLVDAPRATRSLGDAIEALGGVRDVLLTHRDDVSGAETYAARFNARVWIHASERDAAPFATDLIEGPEPVELRPGLVAHHAPGHTLGSVVYHLEDRYLFTGDTLFWNHRRGVLDVFARQTWHSWDELTATVAALAPLPVSWVLPGHGRWGELDEGQFSGEMTALAADMARVGQDRWSRRHRG